MEIPFQNRPVTSGVRDVADHPVLEERARKLAAPPEELSTTLEGDPCLTVHLGAERYALPGRFVREVLPLRERVVLPGTPDFIAGITNVRGEVHAVVDLQRFFGLKSSNDDRAWVVLVEAGSLVFGLLVDEIGEVLPIDLDKLQPLPHSSDSYKRFLIGVTENQVAVLDIERLVADSALMVGERK